MSPPKVDTERGLCARPPPSRRTPTLRGGEDGGGSGFSVVGGAGSEGQRVSGERGRLSEEGPCDADRWAHQRDSVGGPPHWRGGRAELS